MEDKAYRVVLVVVAIVLFPIGFPITAIIALWHAAKGMKE